MDHKEHIPRIWHLFFQYAYLSLLSHQVYFITYSCYSDHMFTNSLAGVIFPLQKKLKNKKQNK